MRPDHPVTIKFATARRREILKRFERKRLYVADTTKIEDKLERKKLKRAARKKAAPKAKRTTPRGAQQEESEEDGPRPVEAVK